MLKDLKTLGYLFKHTMSYESQNSFPSAAACLFFLFPTNN